MVIRQKYNKYENSRGFRQFFKSSFDKNTLLHITNQMISPVMYIRVPIIVDGEIVNSNITTSILNVLIDQGYGKTFGQIGNIQLVHVPNVVENFHRFDQPSNTHFVYVCIAYITSIDVLSLYSMLAKFR